MHSFRVERCVRGRTLTAALRGNARTREQSRPPRKLPSAHKGAMTAAGHRRRQRQRPRDNTRTPTCRQLRPVAPRARRRAGRVPSGPSDGSDPRSGLFQARMPRMPRMAGAASLADAAGTGIPPRLDSMEATWVIRVRLFLPRRPACGVSAWAGRRGQMVRGARLWESVVAAWSREGARKHLEMHL